MTSPATPVPVIPDAPPSAAYRPASWLPCRLRDCPDDAEVVVVTLREGYLFERCAVHALSVTLWPPHPEENECARP